MDLLTVDRLVKSFGAGANRKHAVRGVSLNVPKGEVLAFLGPNGAGKSTTMRMVSGYLEPDRGDALIAGASITQARRDAQMNLGYLAEGAPPLRRSHRQSLFVVSGWRTWPHILTIPMGARPCHS